MPVRLRRRGRRAGPARCLGGTGIRRRAVPDPPVAALHARGPGRRVRRGRLRRDVRHGRLQLLPSARRSHPEPAGRDGAAPARRRYRRRARRRDRRLDLGSGPVGGGRHHGRAPGGGPGVMEAANLGSYLSGHDVSALTAAIDRLALAPDFRDHDPYTAAALEVREMFPAQAVEWPRRGGLSIPTWLYGHEPANLFAAQIAKYFSNAIREDTILRLARGGIVFATGSAGTIQEVFQAATKTFYATDGVSGPFIFLDADYWTNRLPVRTLLGPLLAASPAGDLSSMIHLTDDVAEAVALLTS